MLPRIDLQFARYGTPALSLEFDVVHFTAGRGQMGAVLQLPIRDVSHTRPAGAIVTGMLSWKTELIGLAIPAQPLLLNTQFLVIPVSDEDLARIEIARAGESPQFLLNLNGLVTGERGTEPANGTHPGTTLMVPRETWLEVLERVGYGKRQLLELPAAPARGLWPDALAQIHEASRRLRSADAGASLASSRVAAERLIECIGAAVEVPREGKPIRNYAEELAAFLQRRHVDRSSDVFAIMARSIDLLYAIFGPASEPAHKGLNQTDRETAELALAMVTSLYLSGLRILRE
jgi:hypothetical protein